jgi:CBS domain-containing protein
MAAKPSFCTADDTALRAAQLMKNEDVGSLPVVRSDSDRQVIGIVTDRDLTLRVIVGGRAAEGTPVSEVMTTNPVTCRMNDDVHEAMKAMSRQQVRRIPVVDDQGKLCGIVAQADIARHVDEREAGEVVEDISQPGHNAIGRAFRGMTSSSGVRGEGRSHGIDWLMAAGIGAAFGAGLMALVDRRRSAASGFESDSSVTANSRYRDAADELGSQPL